MERPQMILTASAAVAVWIAGYFAYDAVNVSSEADQKLEEANQLKNSIEKYYSGDVFPSKENIQRVKDEYVVINALRASVTNKLGSLDMREVAIDQSRFIDVLRDTAERWKAKAPVVEGEKCVSSDFAFGFEKYIGGNTLPDEANIPRLVQQLRITDVLVEELFNAKIAKLNSIVREGFDGAAPQVKNEDEEEQAGGRRNRRNRRKLQQEESKPKTGAAVKSIEHPLFTAQHFTIAFSSRQVALIDVLNRFAKAKVFVVVTDVTVNKGGISDVRIPSEPKKKDEGSSKGRRGKGAAEEEKTAEDSEFSELPAGSRLMSGPDLDPLLDVVLELDVYNFAEGK